ncbi:Craniofacial development protein 2 [Biomphalaria glabrata]|nr:Craniofacial development protein 2 [Biomphalaria glabrata]
MRLATWNVRTMCPGLTDDLRQIDDARKTAVINNELKRLHIDIAALQETRLAENGMLRETDYTFFWKGKAQDDYCTLQVLPLIFMYCLIQKNCSI